MCILNWDGYRKKRRMWLEVTTVCPMSYKNLYKRERPHDKERNKWNNGEKGKKSRVYSTLKETI